MNRNFWIFLAVDSILTVALLIAWQMNFLKLEEFIIAVIILSLAGGSVLATILKKPKP